MNVRNGTVIWLCAASTALGWALACLQAWVYNRLRSQGRLEVCQRPLVTLDLETTGLSVSSDRIIEIAAVKVMPGGKVIVKGPQRINPSKPISEESSSITGIHDSDVQGAPSWQDVATEWREFLEGCVLHGYNAKRFDVPLLRAEFDRVGILNFPPLGTPVVDSCRIFFTKEQRTLAAAVAHYCGRELEGAHGALPDTQAALDVLCAQVERYPDLPRTPEGLAAWCSGPTKPGDVTWDGKFRWSGDTVVFGFGKLQGHPLSAVAVEERDYLHWAVKQDFSDESILLMKEALAGRPITRETVAALLGI